MFQLNNLKQKEKKKANVTFSGKEKYKFNFYTNISFISSVDVGLRISMMSIICKEQI